MRTSFLFALMMAALVLPACQESPGTPPAQVEALPVQGLSLLDLQPGFSFTASFARGQDVIYIQAVRGVPTPEEYRNDPTYPAYEIDVRVTDRDGRLLYIRKGGDDFIDPTWEDDLIVQDELPALTPNAHLFELLAEASDALEAEFARTAGREQAAGFIHEIRAVQSFGKNIREELPRMDSLVMQQVEARGFIPLFAGGGGTDGPEDGAKSLNAGFYYLEVHDKSCCLGLGRHSATRLKKANFAGSYSYFDFCNHGTCAGDMGTRCGLPLTQKPNWTAYTCRTEYKAQSNSPGHNCHDDTRVQMAAFVWGASNDGYQLWCNDGDSSVDISDGIGDQSGAPDCNEGTSKGYNHPGMNYFAASNTASATQNTATLYVTLSAGATYTFSTCGAASGDTYLRLKTFSGVEMAYNDDDYGCGSNIRASTLGFSPSYTGTYVLHMGCFSSESCSGNVRVRLVSSALSEPTGNYYSTSDTNSANQNYFLFWFYLQQNGIYRFSTCGTTASDTFLRLRNPSWVEVASNDDDYTCAQGNTSSTITYTAPASGYYYIQAGCWNSSACDGTVNFSQTGWAPTGTISDTAVRDEASYYN